MPRNRKEAYSDSHLVKTAFNLLVLQKFDIVKKAEFSEDFQSVQIFCKKILPEKDTSRNPLHACSINKKDEKRILNSAF
jgi:hypothetical protein